jgi:hypothetical protein
MHLETPCKSSYNSRQEHKAPGSLSSVVLGEKQLLYLEYNSQIAFVSHIQERAV